MKNSKKVAKFEKFVILQHYDDTFFSPKLFIFEIMINIFMKCDQTPKEICPQSLRNVKEIFVIFHQNL